MNRERRIFEREQVNIPFIYSLDAGDTIADGEWFEAQTIDIGPVLVGGLAFYSDKSINVDDTIRIALFMDLELKKSWHAENEKFPIYRGTVCRITQEPEGRRIAILFNGFDRNADYFLETAESPD